MNTIASGDSTLVEHLPHDPEVKGLSPGASVRTERVEKEPFSDMTISSSTVVEQTPHHPRAECFGTIATAGTR